MILRALPFFLLLATLGIAAEAPAGPVTLDGQVKPLLKEFCFDCHNKDKQKGDLNLIPLTESKLDEHRETWEKIAELVEAHEMPPPKKKQPSDAQRDVVLHFIDGQFAKLDCTKTREPGKVTIRRLNKEEYKNTIRDLLNVTYEPEDFPNDEVGYGFDNIADVLSLSPLLMEKFLTAAETIAKQAISLDPNAKKLPEAHKRLIMRMPGPGQEHEVALETINRLAKVAYRRPVTEAELEHLASFVDLALKNGGSFLEGIQAAVQATLCSPHFLFRWELDPQPLKPGESRELNDYEVASRLSYFLWSSMPDPELRTLAANGELRKNGNLEKQIARMTQDWKSYALVNNFAGQWLQIRNIWETEIDPATFPKWDNNLKGAMKEETERFFTAIMREDRPITDLIDADFTFLNDKLAKFYGIEGVKGKEFQRVTLPADSPRGGVLTQGSVLLSTSTPTRTSPVIRGKWILEQILGTPPPPPPPDVPPLPEQKTINQSSSVRQRLEQHRSNADCAGCHAKMDPLGFALENFDATGAWRDSDGKFPIDATGELSNGDKFNGPRELKQTLKGNKNFVRCLTRKMMTYALGRGLEYPDKCAVDKAVEQVAKHDNKFSALVTAIVTSDPFLQRKAEIAKR